MIEADGAKRLPLKVPGEWEPVIPDFTDLVVGVIGMDAVGQMIRESCHRPERVAAFLNKEQTDPVTGSGCHTYCGVRQGFKKSSRTTSI